MGLLDKLFRRTHRGGRDFDDYYVAVRDALLERAARVGPQGGRVYHRVLLVRVLSDDPEFIPIVREWLEQPDVVRDLHLELLNEVPRGVQVRLPRLRFEVRAGAAAGVELLPIADHLNARLLRTDNLDLDPVSFPIPVERDVLTLGRARWFIDRQVLNDVVLCAEDRFTWISRAACLLHWFGDCGELESYMQGRYVYVEKSGTNEVITPHLRISGRAPVAAGDHIVFSYRGEHMRLRLALTTDSTATAIPEPS